MKLKLNMRLKYETPSNAMVLNSFSLVTRFCLEHIPFPIIYQNLTYLILRVQNLIYLLYSI